jgi:hypothetical protein
MRNKKIIGVDLAACYKQFVQDMTPSLGRDPISGEYLEYLNVYEAKRCAAMCSGGEFQEMWDFTFTINVA